MSAAVVIAAITRRLPPQRGQNLRSISNTRRKRCIQLIGAVGFASLDFAEAASLLGAGEEV